MKIQLQAITTLAFCAAFVTAQAQVAPRGGMMGATPHGLDFSGPTGKLFGDNTSFSANLTMQVTDGSGGQPASTTGKIAASDGKTRFEMDLTKAAGASMPPQRAAMMKSMGMDRMVMISRPDKKVTDLVYTGLNAYAETAIPDSTGGSASKAKVDTTELGKETVDGHPCVKNKVVVTDDQGNKHESTVWNAMDLKNFPVKIETSESGTTSTMTFSDVKLDKVADDQFEPPTGATKYDNVSTMMQQEMMKRAANRGGGQ